MNLVAKKKLYLSASDYYYNKRGHTKLTDAEFDKLEALIRKVDPQWDQLAKTGIAVDKKTEVPLDFFMPSLEKRYPDKIDKWTMKQGDKLLAMNKLDGTALQLTYRNGKPCKLVTRGDGTRGGDISFLLPYLNIPKKIPLNSYVVFRCEGVMREAVFKKLFADKFENARGLVNGWFNRKKPDPDIGKVDIVVLGVYGLPILNGLSDAEHWGFSVVDYEVITDYSKLSALLATRKKSSVYSMDGLVLCPPIQKFWYVNADKPKWAIAFKQNTDIKDAVKATVKQIIWQDSLHSTLIPKIEIVPVRLGGTTVTYATCHNAKWMIDRSIGPGAVVNLVRSGDVIPKIIGVVKKGRVQMPVVPHKWKGVHLKALTRSREADIRALHKFLKTLGIEFIAVATIGKLYDGGIKTPHDYMRIWSEYDDQVFISAGLGQKMTDKIYAELERVFKPGVLLRDLMVASNCMEIGLGDRKLKQIERSLGYPALVNLVKANPGDVIETLYEVPGFSDKTTLVVSNSMSKFRKWLKEALKYVRVRKEMVALSAPKSGKLVGVCVSFTGYRDTLQEKYITDNGGEIVPFGAKTKILLYKDGGKASTKLDKARAKGISVTTWERWKK